MTLKSKLLRIQSWRPSAAIIAKEKLVADQLNDYLIMEATCWDQRMKHQWAKDGDRNTRHFHLSVQQRRRKNTISHLQKDDQSWITDRGEITRELVTHFQELFRQPSSQDLPQFSIQGQVMSNLDNEAICRIPTQEEIWVVLVRMGSFTSPGPDGYPPVFYKKYWGMIFNDVVSSIKNIFDYAEFPDLMNHTNITLIPKIKIPC